VLLPIATTSRAFVVRSSQLSVARAVGWSLVASRV